MRERINDIGPNVCFLVSMLKFSCGCSVVGPYYFSFFWGVSSFRSLCKLLISVRKMVVLGVYM